MEVFPTKDFRYQSWMPFCDRGFTEDDAATLCSLLGCAVKFLSFLLQHRYDA